MRVTASFRVSLVCLVCSAVGPSVLGQQPAPLTLREAVALSMQKNPDRKMATADVELAQVGSRVARNALLPNLYFSESALRGNDPVYVFGTRLRQNGFAQSDFALNSLNRPTPVNDFVTRLSGNWTAFDSWHSEFEIRRADLLAKSASDGAARSEQEIVHRTVKAYEAILLATRRLEVARHDVETAQAVQVSSKNRVDAGLAVDADALTAAANLAERQQAEIAAEGEVQIAWAELEAAMGQAIATEQRNLQPLDERQFDVVPLADTVAVAMKSRPDRSSLAKQREAQRTAVQSARSAYGPQINVVGSWEADKQTLAGAGGNNWTAGAELRVDILPMAKRESVAAAKIGLSRMDAATASANQQIQLDVTRAYYQHQSAQQMLAVARASTAQTEESLRTLKDRYEAGLATMTDLLRAEDADRQSRANYWQAVYRNTLTYADLRFADGTLTQDTAGDLQ
jgi:outer membrane protein